MTVQSVALYQQSAGGLNIRQKARSEKSFAVSVRFSLGVCRAWLHCIVVFQWFCRHLISSLHSLLTLFFQEVVMTTAVLQTHHAVQTLPEVSPEFTQAIVQTDISGPITASELTHTVIDKTQTGLPQNEIEQEDEPNSVEQTSVANSTLDGSHGGLTTELQVEGVGDKEVQAVKQTGAVIVIVNNSNNDNDIIIIIIIIIIYY